MGRCSSWLVAFRLKIQAAYYLICSLFKVVRLRDIPQKIIGVNFTLRSKRKGVYLALSNIEGLVGNYASRLIVHAGERGIGDSFRFLVPNHILRMVRSFPISAMTRIRYFSFTRCTERAAALRRSNCQRRMQMSAT